MIKTVNLLEKFYFLLIVVTFIFTIGIVHLIQNDISIGNNIIIREEYIESFFIIILLLLAYILSKLYKKEILKNKNKLEEAFKYIGQINVQLQGIEKNLSGFEKFPENKKEVKDILSFLANNTLSIINADWFLIRIIEIGNLKTLREHIQTRGNSVLLKCEISNKMLIEKEAIDGYSVLTSKQENLGLKAYFIFPTKEMSEKQKMLIKTIINKLEMIFIIFNSKFFKKTTKIDLTE